MAETAGAVAGANDATVLNEGPRGPDAETKRQMALASAQRKVDKARQHLAAAEAHLAELGG